MKRFFSSVIITLCVFGNVFSQIHNNEKLVFVGSYNMSGLMTQLAQVTVSTAPIKTSQKTYLHLSLVVSTFSKWDNFFKIRDLYESYVEPTTLKPSLYKRNILEGNYRKTEKYVFSGSNVKSTSNTQGRPSVNNSVTIDGATLDVVSLMFKLRTVDFSKFVIGQKIYYKIIFDEKITPVTVKYMGTEMVKNAGNMGNKMCYKLSISARTNALRGQDKNLIWLTADVNRVPVFIQFSIPVGTGQIKLSSASGI